MDKLAHTTIPSWVTSLAYNDSILSVKGAKKNLPQLISEVKTLPTPKKQGSSTQQTPAHTRININSMDRLVSELEKVIPQGDWEKTAVIYDFDETLGVRSYREKGNGTPRMLYVCTPDRYRTYVDFFKKVKLLNDGGYANKRMTLIEKYAETLEQYYRLIEDQALLQNMIQSLYAKGASVNICSGMPPTLEKIDLLNSIGIKNPAYSFILQDSRYDSTKARPIARRFLGGFSSNPPPETIVLIDNSVKVLDDFVVAWSGLSVRPKNIITVHYTKFEELLNQHLAEENKALTPFLKAYKDKKAEEEAA